jgi:SWI/SNF-related matrix-associated actin-dependent regulator of chromatin subfamily A member 5
MKNSPGVDLNLPPKTEVLLFAPLTPMQRFWYQRLLSKADNGLFDELFKGAKDKESHAYAEELNEDKAWDGKDIKELEMIDASHNDAKWEDSKDIIKRAIEQEQVDEGKDPAWRKLMNLMMQLRKVRLLNVF